MEPLPWDPLGSASVGMPIDNPLRGMPVDIRLRILRVSIFICSYSNHSKKNWLIHGID